MAGVQARMKRQSCERKDSKKAGFERQTCERKERKDSKKAGFQARMKREMKERTRKRQVFVALELGSTAGDNCATICCRHEID
jgi:hypothetical protein